MDNSEQNNQTRKAFVNLAVEPLDYEGLLKNQFEKAGLSGAEAEKAPKKMWRTQTLQSAFSSIWKKRSEEQWERAVEEQDYNKYGVSNKTAASFIDGVVNPEKKLDTEAGVLARRYVALLALQNSPEYHHLMLEWNARIDGMMYLCKYEYGADSRVIYSGRDGWEWAKYTPAGANGRPNDGGDGAKVWFASNTTEEEKQVRIEGYKEISERIRNFAEKLIRDFVQYLEENVKNWAIDYNNSKELNIDIASEWDRIFYEWLKGNHVEYAAVDNAHIPNMVNSIYKTLCESPAGLYGNWVIPSVILPKDRNAPLSKAADELYIDGNETDKADFTAETLAGWDIGDWCKSHRQAVARFYDVAFAPREQGKEVGGSDRPLNTQFIFAFGNWGGSFHPGWNPSLIPVYNDFHPLLDANSTYWDADKRKSGNTKMLQFLIRAAFDTPMEGAYMTDFYKGISTGTSTTLYIARKSGGQSKSDSSLTKAMFDMLVEEIRQLSDDPDGKPVLVLTSGDGWKVISEKKYQDDEEKKKLFEPWKVIRWPHQSNSNPATQKADVLAFSYGRIERALQYIDESRNGRTHVWRWSFNASGIEDALKNLAKRSGKTYRRPWGFPEASGEPQMSLWEWLKYSFVGKEAVLKLAGGKLYQGNDVETAFVRGYLMEEDLLPRDNGEIPSFSGKPPLSPMGNRAAFDAFKDACGLTDHTELQVN